MRFIWIVVSAVALWGCGGTVYYASTDSSGVKHEYIWNAHGLMDWALNQPRVKTASGASFEASGTTNSVNVEAVRAAAEGATSGAVGAAIKGVKP